MKIFLPIILCFSLTHCYSQDTISLKDSLNKKVTLTGKAINAKLGPFILLNNGEHVWLKNKDSWPNGYYKGDTNAITVKVTGTLIEAFDLPVYIKKEGELTKSGIPVPEGMDLIKASQRFLIQNLKFGVIIK